jgi:hypothetical protein
MLIHSATLFVLRSESDELPGVHTVGVSGPAAHGQTGHDRAAAFVAVTKRAAQRGPHPRSRGVGRWREASLPAQRRRREARRHVGMLLFPIIWLTIKLVSVFFYSNILLMYTYAYTHMLL